MPTADVKFMGRPVRRVYWGRPGCGCGCKGTYSTPDKTRAVNTVFAAFDFVGPVQAHPGMGDDKWVFFNENAVTKHGSPRFAWVYTD